MAVVTSNCFRAVKTALQAVRFVMGLTAAIFFCCAVFLPLSGQVAAANAQSEIELGEKISKEVERVYKLSPDKSLQDRVQRLGRALAAAASIEQPLAA